MIREFVSKGRRKIPEWLENTLTWLLGIDGFLHLIEMGTALYEEAYITASILGFSAIIMFLSCWVLGERHTHH